MPGSRSGDPTPPISARLRTLREGLISLDRQIHEALVTVDELATEVEGERSVDSRTEAPGPVNPGSNVRAEGASSGCAEMKLRLLCLGPFEVYLGKEALHLRGMSKGRSILKYLASRPRQPVRRDVLLQALWPEEDPNVANNRLKVAMHHLRQVPTTSSGEFQHGEFVLFGDGCYMFNPHLPVWTDVEAFDEAWRAGLRFERSGHSEQAIPCFERAESLYRGDYFEDDQFEEWMLVRREELKETYLQILDRLSHFWLRLGVLETAIEGWKKILVKDPWREDVYRQLMVCFARNGQRGVALRWYDICAQVLEKELQLTPEPETTALYHRLRRNEPLELNSPASS
jgi:DNA-binding SARP family transcriptional activator